MQEVSGWRLTQWHVCHVINNADGDQGRCQPEVGPVLILGRHLLCGPLPSLCTNSWAVQTHTFLNAPFLQLGNAQPGLCFKRPPCSQQVLPIPVPQLLPPQDLCPTTLSSLSIMYPTDFFRLGRGRSRWVELRNAGQRFSMPCPAGVSDWVTRDKRPRGICFPRA